MIVVAIDPGSEKSGYIVYDSKVKEILEFGIYNNEELENKLMLFDVCEEIMPEDLILAVEWMTYCSGGESVSKTLFWTGRFTGAWGREYKLISRQSVKSTLKATGKSADKKVRQALIDRFPKNGGGKIKQIGVKSKPGGLYGISSHCWAALAVAITYLETV